MEAPGLRGKARIDVYRDVHVILENQKIKRFAIIQVITEGKEVFI